MTFQVIIATLASSVLSLLGATLLLVRENGVRPLLPGLTSFAAGVLLATAFLDLLPEAFLFAGNRSFLLALAGFLTFYILERAVRSVHSHARNVVADRPSTPLVIIGDTIHNVVDGAVIAGGFLVNVQTGIATAIAVAVHEVPQEIGDFAILLNNGVKRSRVFFLNLWSAMAAIIGALIALRVGEDLAVGGPLVALTAGFFIYIAGSDLIPELHQSTHVTTPWLFAGSAAVWAILEWRIP